MGTTYTKDFKVGDLICTPANTEEILIYEILEVEHLILYDFNHQYPHERFVCKCLKTGEKETFDTEVDYVALAEETLNEFANRLRGVEETVEQLNKCLHL